MDTLNKLTTSQIWANARHWITYVAGILTALGIVSLTQSQDLLAAFNNLIDGLEKVVAALVVIAGAVTTAINSWKAAHNAAPAQQIQAVSQMGKDPASPVKGVITTDTPEGKALAASVAGPTVAAGTPEAAALANGRPK